MIAVQLLCYLCLGVLGCAVVREDLLVGKIRNRHLLVGAVACLCCYGLQGALTLCGRFGWVAEFLIDRFYYYAAFHVAASLLAGLVLWLCDIWPAGDAKFFMLCAAFIPLLEPALVSLPQYLVLRLLVNTFVLAGVYVLVAGLISLARAACLDYPAARQRVGAVLKQALGLTSQWRRLGALVLNMAGLFAAQLLLRRLFAQNMAGKTISPTIVCVVLFLFWEKVGGYLSSGRLAVVSGLLVVLAGSGSLAPLTGCGLLIVAARMALDRCLDWRATRVVGCEGVEPGMLPSRGALALLRRDPQYFEEHFEPIFKDGLSPAQVGALTHWLMGLPKEQASIEVVRGVPFAAWIFSGVLFTLAAPQDAARLLLSICGRLWR